MKLVVGNLKNDNFIMILFASIISTVTAVLIVTPDYQFFKVLENEFWMNLLKIVGNGMIIAPIVAVTVIAIIEIIFRFLDLIAP